MNSQSTQLQGNYAQAQNQANAAQQGASQATNAIQDAGQLYGQDLTNQEQSVGFNPADLTLANKNMVAAQNQVANAPLAAQQAGNYYGTTSGGTTNIYGQLMNNLNPALTNATNSAGALTNEYGQLTTAANQQAGLTSQSQLGKAGAANALYQQSVAQMSAAGSTMTAIEGLAQQQGYLTAEQTTAYQNAYSQYLNAKAQQAQAAAQQTSASAAMMTAQQQVTQYQNIENGMKSLYGPQWQTALAQITNGQAITVPKVGNGGGGLQVGVANPGTLQ